MRSRGAEIDGYAALMPDSKATTAVGQLGQARCVRDQCAASMQLARVVLRTVEGSRLVADPLLESERWNSRLKIAFKNPWALV